LLHRKKIMNKRQIIILDDLRQELYHECNYVCEVCGSPIYYYGTPQLAHRIAQTKANIKKYGCEVIHNRKNLVPVCCLKCNDACNIGYNPEAVKKLVEEIKNDLSGV
jgi:hypothetical protein